ncbi:unnamed protein product [Paramecium primaurelia]|uniref:Transmembrane protein n=1 Tax=Paramecium primaurelia TaxID=5886 RepID=A0A8S1KZQ6_PARPR|nr:unnamed protein product [Paramecium primaurelia]
MIICLLIDIQSEFIIHQYNLLKYQRITNTFKILVYKFDYITLGYIPLNSFPLVFNIQTQFFLINIVLITFPIGLICKNFKFSTAIFNNSIQSFIYQNQKKIEKFFSFIDEKNQMFMGQIIRST